MALLVAWQIQATNNSPEPPPAVVARLVAALPESWAIAQRKANVLPDGHYWGEKYDGARGEEVLISGPADVHVHWLDNVGVWRVEAVAKEALQLTFMPRSYRQSLRRFLLIHRPPSASYIGEVGGLRLYGNPSVFLTRAERLDDIVKQAKEVRWPDSPQHTGSLTWKEWQTHVAAALTKREK